MCGRFTLYADYKVILERFGIEQASFDENEYEPSYNIAPSQLIAAVVSDGNKNRLAIGRAHA